MWDREKWDELLEHALVALLFAVVTVGVVAYGGARGVGLSLVAGLVAVALGVWTVRLWVARTPRLLLHPMVYPGLAFVGYAAWRAATVEVTYPARRELMLIVLAAIVFLIALNNLYRQEPTQWITHSLVALGTVVAGYACYQAVTGSNSILGVLQPPQYLRRASGTFVNPNHLAGFLSLILPLALAQVFVGRGQALGKVLHGYAALAMLAGTAVSMSRGGWMAAAAGLIALFTWLGWSRRELRIPIMVALALIMGGGYIFYRQSEKAQARIENVTADGNVDSGLGRSVLWKPALAMWRDHKWLGVGPAQYDVRFPQYRTPRTQLNPGWVHNEYLNVLTDYGVTGAALAGLTLGALIWGVVRSLKFVERAPGDLGTRSSNRTAFFLGATIGLGALAVHCFVDFDLHIPGIALTATLLTALLAAHIRFATERFWFSLKILTRGVLTLAAIAASIWLVPTAWAFGSEGAALDRVARARSVTPTLISDLETAARIIPDNSRTAFELGENLRRLSFQGEAEWRAMAESAVKWLERASKLNPYDARTRLALGKTYRWLNDPVNSGTAFQQALILGPNDVQIANTLAWHALEQGRPDDALRLTEQSLSWQWWSNEYAEEIQHKANAQLKARSASPELPK